MTATATIPLDVELLPPARPPLAGEWVPLTFLLRCPQNSPRGVCLRTIGSRDRRLTVDNDLLLRDIVIGPGEMYRATLRVHAPAPIPVQLEAFFVEYVDEQNQPDAFDCPAGTLTFRPSLAHQVKATVESLCTYEEGVKVQITLEHTGADLLNDLSIHLEPETAVVSARSIRRGKFRPKEKEQFEAVLRPGPVEIVVSAAAFGTRTETRLPLRIEPVSERDARPPFRFLEPRQLSRDQITLRRGQEPDAPAVGLHHGAFPVLGKEKYQLVIQPRSPGVSDIALRDLPERIVVLSKKRDASSSSWTFLLEVTAGLLLSQPQRIYYNVASAAGPLAGEVHLKLRPPRLRYLRFAAALGAALTVQGAVGLFRVLGDGADLNDRFVRETVLSWDFQRNLWFALSIPLFWAVMPLVDALQYRLTAEP